MRLRLALICIWALIASAAPAQTKKVIAVIGSSTAAGFGASIPDSAWVNLWKKFGEGLGEIDTVYNLAQASTTTYVGLPTGYPTPGGRPAVDPTINITKAMSFNPDIVIIAYPSNDIGLDFTLTEYLQNLRTMAAVVTSAGKTVYVTSTQPRDDFNTTEKQNLQTGKDSIMQEFGSFALDFYDQLVDPATLGFNPLYTSGGVHPNDAGHQLLYQVAKNNIILSTPLPITLVNFKGFPGDKSILLQWRTGDEDDPTAFDIQRSADGVSFESIGSLTGKGKGQGANYSFNDMQPLSGRNMYRLAITSGAEQLYSSIVSIATSPDEGSGWIGRIFPPNGNLLNIELNIPANQSVELTLYTAGGTLVAKNIPGPLSPGAIVPMPLPSLAAGLYFVTVTSANGHRETKAFSKP
jgi:lysophospholipase L1-like esterase